MLKTDYDIPIFKDEDIADLNEYSNEMASALKTQLDKFGNPLVYKGKVATLEDLPNEAESGNIYSVISENKNYIYNGTEWVEYSSTLNLNLLIDYKYHLNVTSTISANTNFTIPCYYKVGENVLDVYYMGERLIKTTDDIEGNYKEIGETGSISNIIQLDGWSAGDLTDIAEYFEFVVRR